MAELAEGEDPNLGGMENPEHPSLHMVYEYIFVKT